MIDLDSAVEKESDEPENEKEDESEEDSGDEIIVLDVEKRSLCAKSTKKASDLKNDGEAATSQATEEPTKEPVKEPIEEPEEPPKAKEADEPSELSEKKSTEAKPVESKNEETENSEKHQDTENAAADDSEDADRPDADAAKGRESTSSRITLVSMGAPVPAALNGEKPPLENFGVGMGPMIHFENLPNSTGVFDKMRKVIKKIRKKLS